MRPDEQTKHTNYHDSHATTGANEVAQEATAEPEKKGFTNKQKIIGAIAGIALLVGGYGIAKNTEKTPQVSTEIPSAPIVEQQALPKDAVDFISEFGDRYSDPVSTYYAEAAYEEKSGGVSAIISDSSIENSYASTINVIGDKSELGFTRYRLPVDAKIDQETSLKIFNEYTAKNLELYMNLLAKNPSPEAEVLINSQFKNYCSDALGDHLPATAFPFDNAGIEKMMATGKTIVSEHGSAANYKVALAADYTDAPDSTSFNSTTSNIAWVEFKDQKIPVINQSGVRLVIDINVYNKNTATNTRKTLNDVSLSIIRQPEIFDNTPGNKGFSYVSIGQTL